MYSWAVWGGFRHLVGGHILPSLLPEGRSGLSGGEFGPARGGLEPVDEVDGSGQRLFSRRHEVLYVRVGRVVRPVDRLGEGLLVVPETLGHSEQPDEPVISVEQRDVLSDLEPRGGRRLGGGGNGEEHRYGPGKAARKSTGPVTDSRVAESMNPSRGL